jgi:hypothetical protein
VSDFDPDAFVSGGDDFDPDAFVADAQPRAPGESQDVGPPAPAGAQLAPTKEYDQARGRENRWRDLLSKSKAAGLGVGQGALAGFADEAAALGAAAVQPLANALGYPEQTMGEAYRETRTVARNMHDQARADAPWSYGLGQVGGSLGQVGALGKAGIQLASRGAQAVKQGAALGALTGLGGSTDDLTNGELGGAAVDAGIGAGLGAATSWLVPKAIDAAKNPLAKAKESLGNAMQWPQRAYEAVAERVGRTDMAQRSSSAASDVAGPVASAQVKALRQLRDNADLGSELATTLRAKTDELGGIGNKLVSAMDQHERGQVAKAMAELLQTRGLTDVTPEFVGNNMDELARAAGLDLGDLTGNTFLRMANKRDPQWWVSAGEGVRKFWTSRGMAGEAMDPRMQAQFAGNAGLADDFTLGKLDRLGRPMSDAGPGKYQFGVGEMEGKLAALSPEATGVARAMAKGQIAGTPDSWRMSRQQIASNPEALDALRSLAVKRRSAPGFERVTDLRREVAETVPLTDAARARQSEMAAEAERIAAPLKAGWPAEDKAIVSAADQMRTGQRTQNVADWQAALGQQQANAATGRLRDIATGRNFLQQKALPIAGALAGGGSGAGMGMLGVLSGAPLGAGAASRAPVVADALGELGQGLSQSGRDAIKESVRKMASDPLKIQKLADVPGAVGNAARWALEKAQDPASFAARSYVLSLQPEFRKMLAGGDEASP